MEKGVTHWPCTRRTTTGVLLANSILAFCLVVVADDFRIATFDAFSVVLELGRPDVGSAYDGRRV